MEVISNVQINERSHTTQKDVEWVMPTSKKEKKNQHPFYDEAHERLDGSDQSHD